MRCMKILLFGSNGMLGKAVKVFFLQQKGVTLFTAARKNADFCVDFANDEELEKCFHDSCPDVVINCAAIVNLDICENDSLSAYLINARFVSVLVSLCNRYDSSLIHISTDHFFTGDKKIKHNENASLSFVNEYSRTKFCGEQFALQYEKSLVIRTNIVGFKGVSEKQTFLEWAINSISEGKEINLFTDFYTSSIHTVQLAKIIYDMIRLSVTGLYNVASSDVFSKKEFVLELSEALFHHLPNYKDASVRMLSCNRANSLGLECSKVENVLGYKMPSLKDVINSIKEEYLLVK